jgi:hypothetical protein
MWERKTVAAVLVEPHFWPWPGFTQSRGVKDPSGRTFLGRMSLAVAQNRVVAARVSRDEILERITQRTQCWFVEAAIDRDGAGTGISDRCYVRGNRNHLFALQQPAQSGVVVSR